MYVYILILRVCMCVFVGACECEDVCAHVHVEARSRCPVFWLFSNLSRQSLLLAPPLPLLAGLASQLALGMPWPRLHVPRSQVASTSAPFYMVSWFCAWETLAGESHVVGVGTLRHRSTWRPGIRQTDGQTGGLTEDSLSCSFVQLSLKESEHYP